MSTPTFAETRNLVAFLEKPAESTGFEQIINFLTSKPIHYALTMNPKIYVSYVKQFWATVKVKTVNDKEQIQALVDKKKVTIMKDSIRSGIRFDDAEGTACLLNEAIFEGLARMGAKTTTLNEFSNTMTSAIICLVDNQKFNFLKYIFDNMVKSLEGGVKFYLFSRFLQVFLDKQVEGMARHKEMYIIYSHNMGDTPVETHQTPIVDQPSTSKPKRNNSLNRKQRKETEVSHDDLQEQVLDLQEAKAAQAKKIVALKKKVSKEDASKNGRMIKEIDQNTEIALDGETHGRTNDDEIFRVDGLAGEEVVMETTTGVKYSAAPTTNLTEDEVTMAQALAALKSTKPRVVVQEQDMSTTIPAAATIVTIVVLTLRAKGNVFHEQKQSQIPIVFSLKDKGKAKMIEPEVPIKKKDQMRIDEEYARNLKAKEQQAARISRAQQDEESNNSWDTCKP
nr:hypothetical protein [Tanacetum cinerariifolium]